MTPGDRPRVLIVDDEERYRTTLCRLLGIHGLEAAAAGSGEEALEELKRRPYDVILLDIRMPGMSGIQALAEIKKLDPLAEVIVLTGHASVDAAMDIMRLGGYDYLLKHCPIEEVLDIIDAAYDRKLERAKRQRPSSPPENP